MLKGNGTTFVLLVLFVCFACFADSHLSDYLGIKEHFKICLSLYMKTSAPVLYAHLYIYFGMNLLTGGALFIPN